LAVLTSIVAGAPGGYFVPTGLAICMDDGFVSRRFAIAGLDMPASVFYKGL
jgi:hypothetical protein